MSIDPPNDSPRRPCREHQSCEIVDRHGQRLHIHVRTPERATDPPNDSQCALCGEPATWHTTVNDGHSVWTCSLHLPEMWKLPGHYTPDDDWSASATRRLVVDEPWDACDSRFPGPHYELCEDEDCHALYAYRAPFKVVPHYHFIGRPEL